MELQHHNLTISEGIAVVTMNRPPVNAQNRGMREEGIRLFDWLSDAPEVRVVILTGSGDVFSAGADIKERRGMTTEQGDYVRHNRQVREYFYAITDCEKPVIAAVNGPAIGAGFALMLASDIMLASENAWFQMPEVNVGLSGGNAFVANTFSKSRSRAMYMTARKYPASELYRLGVLECVVPRDALMEEAMSFARDIAAKSALAIATAKRAFVTGDGMAPRDAYRFEQGLTAAMSRSREANEAQAAFVEKRAARYEE